MPPGERVLGAASLWVCESQALPPDMRAATREIRKVETMRGSRGLGQASSLMRYVCDEADRAWLTLVLWPQAFGDAPMSQGQLIAWYARSFGFVELPSLPGHPMMARTPRPICTPIAAAAAEAACV